MSWFQSIAGQIVVFVISAIAIWYFCQKLSDVVEYIDAEFGLGSAFGGTMILAIVTNLPEIAITTSGSIQGNFSLVAGNLLGGIAMQSLLLVLYDFSSKDKSPLSTLTSTTAGKFQGIILIVILILCYFGGETKNATKILGADISTWIIPFIWVGSLLYLKKLQPKTSTSKVDNPHHYTRKSSIIWLAVISVIVLVFGALLETTSDAIASKFNISGVFFGATVLAFVTSLPEISSGLEFVRNKDYLPIISDIFGGNGFLPLLFLPASLISGQNVLSDAGESNNFIALLSIVLTAIFLVGMVKKSPNKLGKLGWDTWLMLLAGIIGFVYLYKISS